MSAAKSSRQPRAEPAAATTTSANAPARATSPMTSAAVLLAADARRRRCRCRAPRHVPNTQGERPRSGIDIALQVDREYVPPVARRAARGRCGHFPAQPADRSRSRGSRLLSRVSCRPSTARYMLARGLGRARPAQHHEQQDHQQERSIDERSSRREEVVVLLGDELAHFVDEQADADAAEHRAQREGPPVRQDQGRQGGLRAAASRPTKRARCGEPSSQSAGTPPAPRYTRVTATVSPKQVRETRMNSSADGRLTGARVVRGIVVAMYLSRSVRQDRVRRRRVAGDEIFDGQVTHLAVAGIRKGDVPIPLRESTRLHSAVAGTFRAPTASRSKDHRWH